MRHVLISVFLILGFTGFAQVNYSFYAVHDRLLDTETSSFSLELMDFSGDGSTIVLAGKDQVYGTPVVYTLNSDGSNLQQVALPEGVTNIKTLTIDSAGSVIYFASVPVIYKAENGIASQIFHMGDDGGRWDLYNVKTCGSGEYLFIRPSASFDAGEILRINKDGSGLVQVMYCEDVERDGGWAGGLAEFSVNHEGDKIAFVMNGYHGAAGFRYKGELFLKDAEGYHQVTNDSKVSGKGYPEISGDGKTIVFFSDIDEDMNWYAINTDGTDRVPIATHGGYLGADVSYDGSMMIHGDGSGNWGCLVATDGSRKREIFTSTLPWILRFSQSGKDRTVKMSDDGSKICYLTTGSTGEYALYVCHFNNPFAVPDAPIIEQITVSPSVFPDTPEASLVLETRISDPQGPADVYSTVCDELVEGKKMSVLDAPVFFQWDPNDLGDPPDQVAGDGIYSSNGKTQTDITLYEKAGIRIGVIDKSWNVVVADTVFGIGEPSAVLEANRSAIRIWPNPVCTGGKLSIALADNEIRSILICNCSGAVIYAARYSQPVSELSIEVDSRFNSGGVYFLQMMTAEGMQTSRFQVLQR